MLQVREIRVTGIGQPDAFITLGAGPNVLAGDSDTGKSFLLHCLDYILGAEEFAKRIPESERYSQLFVEFENSTSECLTLERSLSGGDLAVHRCKIADIQGEGEKVSYRRHGKSTAADVTSVLFPFAGIKEAVLRKNGDGKTQRLTIRTFLPLILIDEVSVIDELSPVLGRTSFDQTARKRMFAYMLSGKDDTGVIAAEKKEITSAKLTAQLGLIDDLLNPLQERLKGRVEADTAESIEKLDDAIDHASEELSRAESERGQLLEMRETAFGEKVKAETQLLAIDELLTRYQLLSERYTSDLERLDFIAEGAHYFEGLQEVNCPLCGQIMGGKHEHAPAKSIDQVYKAARAEAAKILAQSQDLDDAISSLASRRGAREAELASALATLQDADQRLSEVVQPALTESVTQLRRLTNRRLELETTRNDIEQADTLQALKDEIQQATAAGKGAKKQWEELPSQSVRKFCKEIETVLREWEWKGECRVEFDDKKYDLIIDGQKRLSHGKGVRAVLYSAFVIGLLRYCNRENLPHPGFVVIDSPLTSYQKKGAQVKGSDGAVDAGVEAAFWRSLTTVAGDVQILIVENKAPPHEVAKALHYEWFAGEAAGAGDRFGFFPT